MQGRRRSPSRDSTTTKQDDYVPDTLHTEQMTEQAGLNCSGHSGKYPDKLYVFFNAPLLEISSTNFERDVCLHPCWTSLHGTQTNRLEVHMKECVEGEEVGSLPCLFQEMYMKGEEVGRLSCEIASTGITCATSGLGRRTGVQPVIEEIQRSAEDSGDRRNLKMCLGMLKSMRNRCDQNFVAYRKGLGVVCNKKGGFGVDDFVVEFFGEVYPSWRWYEKQDGIKHIQNNSEDQAPEFYNIMLERPKVLLSL
ncbi:Histone-lysine N-methyltransferase ATXR3 [Zea mays]|uniref:Histone-lysine N-methyltransferase ATXR3 n=1 Tax=Zea mays TaxID=4577 RepID=A0A1D6PYP3_MAIZE|nr:Histone-lysine N-methyltransferase ATXR3 [Zea mays]